MKYGIKKLVSLTLVLAISVVMSIPAFATTTRDTGYAISKQSDGTYKDSGMNNAGSVKIRVQSNGMYKSSDGTFFSKVNDDTYIKVKEVNIPLTGESAAKSAIQNNNVQNETAQYILDTISSSKRNHISLDNIKVYVPLATNSTRTYKGYGNKTYYEETVTTQTKSSPTDINESEWGSYSKSVIKGIVNKIVSDAMDSITFGSFSIASIFVVPSRITNSTDITHYAVLHEDKTSKHTYVVDNGQYYFGALTETSWGNFGNFLSYPGGDGKEVVGKNVSIPTQHTPNYNSPDRKAYYNYLGNGWVETIDSYEYGGVNFPSNTAS